MILSEEQVASIREKLESIVKREGRYSMDQLEFAENVIEDNAQRAREIQKILEDVTP